MKKYFGVLAKVLILVIVLAGVGVAGWAVGHKDLPSTQAKLTSTKNAEAKVRKELAETTDNLHAAQSEADSNKAQADLCHAAAKALDDMVIKALDVAIYGTGGNYFTQADDLDELADMQAESKSTVHDCLQSDGGTSS